MPPSPSAAANAEQRWQQARRSHGIKMVTAFLFILLTIGFGIFNVVAGRLSLSPQLTELNGAVDVVLQLTQWIVVLLALHGVVCAGSFTFPRLHGAAGGMVALGTLVLMATVASFYFATTLSVDSYADNMLRTWMDFVNETEGTYSPALGAQPACSIEARLRCSGWNESCVNATAEFAADPGSNASAASNGTEAFTPLWLALTCPRCYNSTGQPELGLMEYALPCDTAVRRHVTSQVALSAIVFNVCALCCSMLMIFAAQFSDRYRDGDGDDGDAEWVFGDEQVGQRADSSAQASRGTSPDRGSDFMRTPDDGWRGSDSSRSSSRRK